MWEKVKFLIQEIRSRKVFRTWLYSYLLLLIMSIIAGLLLYSVAFRYTRQEVDRSQYQALERIMDSLDATISSVSETALAVINNSKVTSLKKYTSYTRREYELIRELNTELFRLETANRYIDTIWISFNRSGYLLSDTLWYQPGWCEKELSGKMGFTLAEWEEAISGQGRNGLYLGQGEQGTCLYYMLSWAERKGTSPEVSVLVYLKNTEIQKLLAGTDSQTWIVDKEKQYFSAGTVRLEEEVLQFVKESEQPYEIMKSRDSYIKKLTSENYGYTLVHIVSKAGYLQAVNRFWLFVWCYLAFSLIAGGFMAVYLTRHHYSAVERLLAVIHKNRAEQAANGEFLVIERAIRQLEQRNQKLNQNQDKKNEALKSIQMSALLKGRRRLTETESELYGSIGKLSDTGRYLLVGFELEQEPEEEAKREEQGTDSDWLDILYFMMENVCEEVYGEVLGCCTAEVDGVCVSLLSLSEDTTEEMATAIIREKTELICFFFWEKAGTTLTGNITELGWGKASIGQLYSQIQEMVRFRDWVGTKQQILVWQELYQWQDEEQQREYRLYRNLADLLEKRSYQEMQKILHTEVENETEKEDRLATEEIVTIPHRQRTEMSRNIESEEAASPTGNNAALAGRIQEYIQGHFAEPELNVNWLAEYFEVSQSNLSQIFKRYYSMGPLEYIHRQRLECAKKYLEGKDSIAQIAEQVGYYSTRPLIRCFKQYENMTPSEYRERLKQ